MALFVVNKPWEMVKLAELATRFENTVQALCSPSVFFELALHLKILCLRLLSINYGKIVQVVKQTIRHGY